MRIIQSANTFGGSFPACGMSSIRVFQETMKESINVHLAICGVVVYVDEWSKEALTGIVPEENMVLFDFKIELRDRLKYVGKFQVQEIQKEPYLHVDLDAIVTELPEKSDAYIWKYRTCKMLGKVANDLEIDHAGIFRVPCSSVIGFYDMKLKDKYISEVYKRFQYLDTIEEITYEYAYTLEEILFESIMFKNKATVNAVTATHK